MFLCVNVYLCSGNVFPWKKKKYLPQSYRNKLLDQWNNLRQWNESINEYITQFNDYMMRCAIKENEAMTLCRFCKGLNDDLRREVVFQGVSTLDQACILVQDYKLVTKNQWMNRQDLIVSLLGFNSEVVIFCWVLHPTDLILVVPNFIRNC